MLGFKTWLFSLQNALLQVLIISAFVSHLKIEATERNYLQGLLHELVETPCVNDSGQDSFLMSPEILF